MGGAFDEVMDVPHAGVIVNLYQSACAVNLAAIGLKVSAIHIN
jgi:hypothetical protein